jgi:flagellar FliL protein
MSEQAETPPPGKEKAAAAGTSKVVLLLLVCNLLASGAAVALPRFLPAAAPAAHAEDAKEHDQKPAAGPIVQIPSVIVNLNEPGAARYLKVSVELEVADPHAASELESRKTVVRDALLRRLSNLTAPETQGEEAKSRIGEELLGRFAKELGPDMVRRVLFTEFVVQ